MNKELYFKELEITLGRSGFTSMPERDGFLSVCLLYTSVCCVAAKEVISHGKT